MSGWFTESSFIPNQVPKPIQNVGSASLLQLQAAVYERERRGAGPSAKRKRELKERRGKNVGVEKRAAADERAQLFQRGEGSEAAAALHRKVERYEKMARGEVAADQEGLVDFHRKRPAEAPLAEAQEKALEEAEDQSRLAKSAMVPPPSCLLALAPRMSSSSSTSGSAALGPQACPEDPAIIALLAEVEAAAAEEEALPHAQAQASALAAAAAAAAATAMTTAAAAPVWPTAAAAATPEGASTTMPMPHVEPASPTMVSPGLEGIEGTNSSKPTTAASSATSSTHRGGVRQKFDRPMLTPEEADERRRLTRETDVARETVGAHAREARASVRERLQALRAAKNAKK